MTVVRFRRPRTWHKPVIATVVVGLTISLAAFAGWHGDALIRAGGGLVAGLAAAPSSSAPRAASWPLDATNATTIERKVRIRPLRVQRHAHTYSPRAFRVIDGDTLALGDERIRIENIDTPESGSRAACASERRRANQATRYARHLLDQTRSVRVIRTGVDRYGRTLAQVQLDGWDMGQAMRDDGHARQWSGRRRPWCRREEMRRG